MTTIEDVAKVLRVTEQAVRKVCVKEHIPKTGSQWVLTPEQLQVLVRNLRLRKGRPSKADQRNYKDEVARIVKFSSQPKPARVTRKPADQLNAKAERVANSLDYAALALERLWPDRDRINLQTAKRIRQTALSLAKFVGSEAEERTASGSGLKPSHGMRS